MKHLQLVIIIIYNCKSVSIILYTYYESVNINIFHFLKDSQAYAQFIKTSPHKEILSHLAAPSHFNLFPVIKKKIFKLMLNEVDSWMKW